MTAIDVAGAQATTRRLTDWYAVNLADTIERTPHQERQIGRAIALLRDSFDPATVTWPDVVQRAAVILTAGEGAPPSEQERGFRLS